MDLREEIQKRIDKKEEELREFELRIREGKAYIQALSETLRFLPKAPAAPLNPDLALRPGTAMAKVRDAIREAGRPLHITDILKALDRPINRENRGSIVGSLSAYVRKGEIFIKTAPNTFGLAGMGQISPWPPTGSYVAKTVMRKNTDEPPDSFGMDENEEHLNGKVEINDDDASS